MADSYDRLRADLGATVTSLPDLDAEDIFVEAAERYPDDAAAASAYSRIIAIRRLLGSSAKMTSYSQNETSVDASDVYKHLRNLLQIWQAELQNVQTTAGSTWTTMTPTW